MRRTQLCMRDYSEDYGKSLHKHGPETALKSPHVDEDSATFWATACASSKEERSGRAYSPDASCASSDRNLSNREHRVDRVDVRFEIQRCAIPLHLQLLTHRDRLLRVQISIRSVVPLFEPRQPSIIRHDV